MNGHVFGYNAKWEACHLESCLDVFVCGVVVGREIANGHWQVVNQVFNLDSPQTGRSFYFLSFVGNMCSRVSEQRLQRQNKWNVKARKSRHAQGQSSTE